MAGIPDPSRLFAIRLRRRRQALGWTRAELARRSGFDPTYIATIERGETNTSMDKGRQLSVAVEMDLGDMIAPFLADDE